MVEETIKSIRETENKADQIVKEAEQGSKVRRFENSKSGKERRRSYAGTGGGRNAQRSRTDEKGGS